MGEDQILNSSRKPELASIDENGDEDLYISEKRPTYFDRYRDIDLDSEQEQAVGENNYIEIDALSLEE